MSSILIAFINHDDSKNIKSHLLAKFQGLIFQLIAAFATVCLTGYHFSDYALLNLYLLSFIFSAVWIVSVTYMCLGLYHYNNPKFKQQQEKIILLLAFFHTNLITM